MFWDIQKLKLPWIFKYLGGTLVLVSIVLFLLNKTGNKFILFKQDYCFLFSLGLFFIYFSMSLRSYTKNATYFGLFFGCLTLLSVSFVSIIKSNEIPSYSNFFIINSFLFYTFLYYLISNLKSKLPKFNPIAKLGDIKFTVSQNKNYK